jgi:hypothetical protein
MRIYTNYRELIEDSVYTCTQSLNMHNDMPFLNQSIILPYIHKHPSRSDIFTKIRFALENCKPENYFNDANLEIYNDDFIELRSVIEKLPMSTFFGLLDSDKKIYSRINNTLDMFGCNYNTEKEVLTLRYGILPNFCIASLFSAGHEKEEYESNLDFFSSLDSYLGNHFELRTQLESRCQLDLNNLNFGVIPKTCYLSNDEIHDCINFLAIKPFDIHSLCSDAKLEDSLVTQYSVEVLGHLFEDF